MFQFTKIQGKKIIFQTSVIVFTIVFLSTRKDYIVIAMPFYWLNVK